LSKDVDVGVRIKVGCKHGKCSSARMASCISSGWAIRFFAVRTCMA
jgi:hypothetical protein